MVAAVQDAELAGSGLAGPVGAPGVSRWVGRLPPSQAATVGMSPLAMAPSRTSWPTPSSWRKTAPGVTGPACPSERLRRRSASRYSLRRYASSSRTARAPPVAEATADITAATTTAVSGATSLCPEGLIRRAISSRDPLRKKTSNPSTRAGTSSNALTSRGHTSDDSRPKTPAAAAAVTAICVALSPLSDCNWKSGSTPARTSIVTVETAHTAMLRHTPLRIRRQRPPPTPSPPHVPARPVREACSHPVTTGGRGRESPVGGVRLSGRRTRPSAWTDGGGPGPSSGRRTTVPRSRPSRPVRRGARTRR